MPRPGGVPEAITVSWLPPEQLNSPSLFYVVVVANGNAFMINSEEDQLQISVSGLNPFTEYNVSVQACSSVGCSPFSTDVTVRTSQGGQ